MFSRRSWLGQILLATVLMALVLALAVLLEFWIVPLSGIVLLLLFAVLAIAFFTDFYGAVWATLLGILSINFFFTAPRYSLHMTDADEIVTALVFFMVALLTSHLATSFRQQREHLRQSQLRSNILLSVSHDLRTPLASIMGNLSTYKTYADRLSSEDKDELLQAAIDESDRLHRYIENLLHATRIQYGDNSVSLLEQDLRIVVAKALERFAQQQRLTVSLPADEVMGCVQQSLLEQAIYNVVDNALKFSPNDSKVAIELNQGGDHVLLRIRDHGEGIDETVQSRVFDVFYSSRKGDAGAGGIGLGLSVTKGIIDLHGGTIRINNSKQGTEVTLVIPTQFSSTGEAK